MKNTESQVSRNARQNVIDILRVVYDEHPEMGAEEICAIITDVACRLRNVIQAEQALEEQKQELGLAVSDAVKS